MESGGSLPHSQEHSICPYPEPDAASPGSPSPIPNTKLSYTMLLRFISEPDT
jgi:hypothetical protein